MADGSIWIKIEADDEQAHKQLAKLNKDIEKTEKSVESLGQKKIPIETKAKSLEADFRAASQALEELKAKSSDDTRLFSLEDVQSAQTLGAELDRAKETLEFMRSGKEFFPDATIKSQAEKVKLLQKDWESATVKAERAVNAEIKNTEKQIVAQEAAVKKVTEQWEYTRQKLADIDTQIQFATDTLTAQKIEAGELAAQISGVSNGARAMGAAALAAQKSMDKITQRLKRMLKNVFVFALISTALRSMRDWMGKVIKTNNEATSAIAKLKGELLTLAQPLIKFVVPAFTAVVNILTRVVTMLSSLFSALSGSTIEESRKAAEALNEQTEALEGTGKAADKAGGQLAGFDEINKLSGDNKSSSETEVNADFSGIKTAVSELEVYLSGLALAVGAILAFSGVGVPLGIALMAVGAAGLASAISENWNAMPEGIQKAITDVLALLGIAALAIGAILAFSGVDIPLGIGLMVAGAAALGGAVALNWESVKEALQGPFGAVMAFISIALLVVGAVIAFSGANLPLGIGLMAAGAIGLATTAALNWESITTALQGPFGALVALISGALLVLGVILLFSGAGAGLGLGLILAGAAGLATVVAFNWNFLSDKVKEVWKNIKTFWNTYIAKVFTKDWWLNLAKNCGNGLMRGFETAINNIISAFESMINWIVEKLNSIGGPVLGFNFSSVSFDRVSLPRLAQGAVIPPNREFLAVLGDQKSGTNIETPLETMVAAFKQAMYETGGSGGGNTTVILELDGVQFGKATFKAYNRESRRVGVNLAEV